MADANDDRSGPENRIDRHPSGFVYVLSNSAMPGYVKIGQTTDNPLIRAIDLYTTGVPTSFKLERALFVKDRREAERLVFEELRRHRVTGADREFFKMERDTAVYLVELIVQPLLELSVHASDQERAKLLVNQVDEQETTIRQLKEQVAYLQDELKSVRVEIITGRNKEAGFSSLLDSVKKRESELYQLAVRRAERAEQMVRDNLGEKFKELAEAKRADWAEFRDGNP